MLRPKTLAVLRYLLERPDKVVASEELQAAVWPETVVSPGVVKNCILELRKALADPAHAPQYIATVRYPRPGYRLITPIPAPAQATQPLASGVRRREQVPPAPPREQDGRKTFSHHLHPFHAVGLVGRDDELEILHGSLAMALEGDRQIIFVTGEPGIGKTAVVEAFVRQASALSGLWIAQGQCSEHYSASEAYLPILEALGRLGQDFGREHLVAVLRQQAPTWLAELPGLLDSIGREQLQRELLGATRERMLRELATALDVLTAQTTFMLVLEDLHWSDPATLDLLFYIARRQRPARLLVIGTYRPSEVFSQDHPLKSIKQERQTYGYCQELALGLLNEAAVEEYLTRRFPRSLLPSGLARVLHGRTDGNPFFLLKVIERLLTQGVIVQTERGWEFQGELGVVARGVPDSIRQLIEKQLDRLSPEERQVLETASTAGMEFSAAAVAAGLGQEVSQVEELCERLARRQQFLQPSGTGVDRERRRTARYSFRHSLCQEVISSQVVAGRRALLHQRIGTWKEAAFGGRGGEHAAELAIHFERGHEYQRAVQYYEQAALIAVRRHAYGEAVDHLTHAIESLKTLSDSPERAQQECVLQTALGVQLTATKGYAAPEVEQAYTRAQELCQPGTAAPQLFSILFGRFAVHLARAEYNAALELGTQLESLARRQQEPSLLLEAHFALGLTLFYRGEFASAQARLEQGIALSDPQQHPPDLFLYRQDPGVACRAAVTQPLWIRGYPEQSVKNAQEALTLAQKLAHPVSVAFALHFAALTHQCRQEHQAAQEAAEAEVNRSREYGFAFWQAMGMMMRGGACAAQGHKEEDLQQMRQGIAAYHATGAKLGSTYWLGLLAWEYGKVEQAETGLALVSDALAAVHHSGERWWEAELLRVKGELLLQSRGQLPEPGVQRKAEEHFRQALDVAHLQEAKALELRTVISLSRLWLQQGKKKRARQMLAKIYGWFTEGFDAADLQEAKTLLQTLA